MGDKRKGDFKSSFYGADQQYAKAMRNMVQ